MTFREFVELVEEMRHAQKDFFRTRSPTVMAQCKRLERKLDAACRQIREGQRGLFET